MMQREPVRQPCRQVVAVRAVAGVEIVGDVVRQQRRQHLLVVRERVATVAGSGEPDRAEAGILQAHRVLGRAAVERGGELPKAGAVLHEQHRELLAHAEVRPQPAERRRRRGQVLADREPAVVAEQRDDVAVERLDAMRDRCARNHGSSCLAFGSTPGNALANVASSPRRRATNARLPLASTAGNAQPMRKCAVSIQRSVSFANSSCTSLLSKLVTNGNGPIDT
jgi:hypothetical protein